MTDDNFSSLFDLLPIGAYRSTLDGRQLRANAALVKLNGYSSEAEMLAAVNNIGAEWYVDAQRREDISAERAAQQTIATSERRFRAMTEKAQVVTLICTRDGVITYASPACESTLGIEPHRLIGTQVFDRVHPDDFARDKSDFAGVVSGTNSGVETVSRFRHRDGTWRYLAALGNNALADNAVGGVIVNLRDVTDARRAEERLTILATIDMLTGLKNRGAFEASAKAELAAVRATPGRRAALFFIDLDRFKSINDSVGHTIGDRVLSEIGRRLQHSAPAHAIVGRLGGDEFAMLVACGDTPSNPEEIAAGIVAALSVPIQIDDMDFTVTASVGVCVFPEHAETFELMLRYADLALIDAELMGLEALVRWRHPTRGLIAPDAFIALAEDVGLIGAIGEIVAELAVKDVARWQIAYGRPLTLALNVSALQLRDATFIDRLREILLRNDFSAQNLELEITESALVASLDLAPGVLRALNRLGARVVLDDLGVAYSSFSYLKQFQVHGVKLDRGFVVGVPSDGTDSAIVRAIISLARSLKLRVVAEGIERPEQRMYLLDQGCAEGQGFLFSKPLPRLSIDALFAAPTHTKGQRVLLLPNR